MQRSLERWLLLKSKSSVWSKLSRQYSFRNLVRGYYLFFTFNLVLVLLQFLTVSLCWYISVSVLIVLFVFSISNLLIYCFVFLSASPLYHSVWLLCCLTFSGASANRSCAVSSTLASTHSQGNTTNKNGKHEYKKSSSPCQDIAVAHSCFTSARAVLGERWVKGL